MHWMRGFLWALAVALIALGLMYLLAFARWLLPALLDRAPGGVVSHWSVANWLQHLAICLAPIAAGDVLALRLRHASLTRRPL